ncbi:hypothetical protein HDU87_002317 [Geranomyces variabilis]|uniref:EF-hand domain-containing protein n=1 Tax=Geranomyces variabilis TaxID=109894 RepID=A0AAD5XTE3_9FUNG|nr:hypothetical protein HDU87_002317 [Geranomyces variabilis]
MADLSEAQISEFKEAFSLFDDDSDGLVDAQTCLTILRACGQCPPQSLLPTLKPSMDFSDFLSLMARTGTKNTDEQAELRAAFDVFDSQRTGFISIAEFKRVMKSVGERLTDDELSSVVQEMEVSDGKVGFDSFVHVMTSRS